MLFRFLTVRYPQVGILLIFVICSLAIAGASALSFSSDNRVFFEENNPDLLKLTEFENTFAPSNNTFLVFENTRNGLFHIDTLRAMVEFTQAAWTTPTVERSIGSINAIFRHHQH